MIVVGPGILGQQASRCEPILFARPEFKLLSQGKTDMKTSLIPILIFAVSHICSAVTSAGTGDCSCSSAAPVYAEDINGYQTPLSQQLESSEVLNAPPTQNLPDFGAFNEQSVAFASTGRSVAAYIDSALVRTQIRFRFDAAYDFNRADRAEYFYTTWNQFGGQNPNPGDTPPGFPEPNIDRQALWLYYEHAITNNVSLFIDVPFIFSNPEVNVNDSGVGDLQAGVKVSLYRDCRQQLTFQLKNYIPVTDASERWLGTGHYSLEPALLYNRQMDRWTLEGEIRDWIAINGAVNPRNGQDYAGNVLRYGLGLGYDLACTDCYNVTPVVELVGWSVLEGQVFDFDAPVPGPVDADGDTIVNIKVGARIANACGSSIYCGWGHALTDDRWYEDIFRFEVRRMF